MVNNSNEDLNLISDDEQDNLENNENHEFSNNSQCEKEPQHLPLNTSVSKTPKRVAKTSENIEEKLRKKKERDEEKQKKEAEKMRKDQLKEEERKRKEEERLKKEEDKKKREEEKVRREKEKEEEKKRREQEKEDEKRKREEEKIKKEKEKEEERFKKEEDKRKKEIEREEEKRRKEEERYLKEMEKQKEEEDKNRKKQRQSAILLNFLVKPDKNSSDLGDLANQKPTYNFIPFTLKKDQRLASNIRVPLDILSKKIANIDQALKSAFPKVTPLEILNEFKFRKPIKFLQTWPIETPDIQLVSIGNDYKINEPGERGSGGSVWLRAKYFHFFENHRPPYYGSFRKKSNGLITGRIPFAKAKNLLDYEVESDDEWEEEEPGESITHSDNEDDEKLPEEEDEEEDDEFFVPHGYLSDDEGVSDNDDMEGMTLEEKMEVKKLRQNLSLTVYDNAHKRGLKKIQPRILGPMWIDCETYANGLLITDQSDKTIEKLFEEDKENMGQADFSKSGKSIAIKKLESKLIFDNLWTYKAHNWNNSIPIALNKHLVNTDRDETVQMSNRKNQNPIPDEAIPHLINLVHYNKLSKKKLCFEFRCYWHRHTVGNLPKCLNFENYLKSLMRKVKSKNQTEKNDKEPLISAAELDNLPFSQRMFNQKLAEIGIYDRGVFFVKDELIQKYSSYIQSINNTLLVDGKITDPRECRLSDYWNYVTDVSTFKKNSAKTSDQTENKTFSDVIYISSPKKSRILKENSLNKIKIGSTESVGKNAKGQHRKRGTLTAFFTPQSKKKRVENPNLD